MIAPKKRSLRMNAFSNRAEPPGNRPPTLLDWLAVLPWLAIGAVLAVAWIVWNLTVRAP
jgi:hypothetical protein